MVDLVLSWVVVIAPTLFALGLELISEKVRKHNCYWKVSIIVFGVTLSALTWLQQGRAIKHAQSDQEHAIATTAEKVTGEVAPKVASETAAQVAETLDNKYRKVIADLSTEIGDLRSGQSRQGDLSKETLDRPQQILKRSVLDLANQMTYWMHERLNAHINDRDAICADLFAGERYGERLTGLVGDLKLNQYVKQEMVVTLENETLTGPRANSFASCYNMYRTIEQLNLIGNNIPEHVSSMRVPRRHHGLKVPMPAPMKLSPATVRPPTAAPRQTP